MTKAMPHANMLPTEEDDATFEQELSARMKEGMPKATPQNSITAGTSDKWDYDPVAQTGSPMAHVKGYDSLERILGLAHAQSAAGKGKARHATGPTGFRPWDQQPILEIGRMVGPGYAAGQVAKKVQEAVTMCGNGNTTSARQEALGAIVYAAALYKLLEEIEAKEDD